MSKGLLFLLGLPGVSFFTLSVAAAATEGELPHFSALIVPLIVIFVLVLLNGFFVAAEIAIVGVRPSRVSHMADAGNKTAAHVFGVVDSREHQDKYIATAQLGITIASLGLAMYGEPQIGHFIEPYLSRWLGEPSEALIATLGYVIALSLLTYLHIVLGEMVPKSLALADSLGVSMRLVEPMRFFEFILAYPVRILNGIGRALMRIARIPLVEGHERVLSQEELELLVSESAEGGLLHEGEEEMIRNIFDFGDRNVGQVMTPRRKVQGIPVNMPFEELMLLAAESRHSRFPVYEDNLDYVIGMLHIKDLARYSLKPSQSKFDVRLMLRSIPVVPEDQPVVKLLAAFKRQRLHMAVVLDEFGGMAGIVTLEDLVEEIVGEVRDEFDQEKEPYVELAPGIVELAGEYLVDDLVEDIVFLGEDGALPDVDTVGGLIVTKLGRPPAVGDQVTYDDGRVRLKVLTVEGRAVTRVRIEYPASEAGSGDSETAVDESVDDSQDKSKPNLIKNLREEKH